MLNNPYQNYQKVQVQTASQGQLILMLFDGATRFCRTALRFIEEKNYEKANTNITKAQAIINELMITLNRDVKEDFIQKLYMLYEYMHHRLVMANIKKDGKIVEEVLGMLMDFRKTWEEVIKRARRTNYNTFIKN